jgi:hypothetical protein
MVLGLGLGLGLGYMQRRKMRDKKTNGVTPPKNALVRNA